MKTNKDGAFAHMRVSGGGEAIGRPGADGG